MFTGRGTKLFGAARYGADFMSRSEDELLFLHEKLVKLFKDLPYGPFQAVSSLVGPTQARILANERHRELVLPDSYLNEHPLSQTSRPSSSRTPSPKKRRKVDHDKSWEIDLDPSSENE